MSGCTVKQQSYRCVAGFLQTSFDIRHVLCREDISRLKIKAFVVQTSFVELLWSLVKRKSKGSACGHSQIAAFLAEFPALLEASDEVRMYDGCEELAWTPKHAAAFRDGRCDPAPGNFIEYHRGDNEIEGAFLKWKWIARVQLRVFRAVDKAILSSQIELSAGLVCDHDSCGPLARVAAQHQGQEVAVTRTEFENSAIFNERDSGDKDVVEQELFKRAAVAPGVRVPLLGDAIVEWHRGWQWVASQTLGYEEYERAYLRTRIRSTSMTNNFPR